MPVDLAVWPANATVGLVAAPVRPGETVFIVRRRCARDALLEAELRGAPEHEVRLLEEGAIAASMTRVRKQLRDGGSVTTSHREQFERDRELMRRFPNDRRGVAGEGWFHLPR